MTEGNPLADEIQKEVPQHLFAHLEARDGAAVLVQELRKLYDPQQLAANPKYQRVWELIGLFYHESQPKRRLSEALQIFFALYEHMLEGQAQRGERTHKGMPLLWISSCYGGLDSPAHAKRYLMLALCEDAITNKGIVPPDTTGVYFRLVWRLGMTDKALKHYATESYRLATQNPKEAIFPEWVLQHLDQDWMTALPSLKEVNVYVVNSHYIKTLLNGLGDGEGSVLEQLAEYIMMCMPGCRTARRKRSLSTDYDIVCSMDGYEVDYRSELGRYFVCECKDWKDPADFTTMAKFCRILDSVKSKFGIVFSKKGISGDAKSRYAEREQLKVFQDRGMVIVVIDENDLNDIANHANFVNLLRRKYERVRLDLISDDT